MDHPRYENLKRTRHVDFSECFKKGGHAPMKHARCDVQLIGSRGWRTSAPLLPLIIASPIIAAAVKGTCSCEEVVVLLPDFSADVLELFVDFVLGKNVCGDMELLAPLCNLLEATGVCLKIMGPNTEQNELDNRSGAESTSPVDLFEPTDQLTLQLLPPETVEGWTSSGGVCLEKEEGTQITADDSIGTVIAKQHENGVREKDGNNANCQPFLECVILDVKEEYGHQFKQRPSLNSKTNNVTTTESTPTTSLTMMKKNPVSCVNSPSVLIQKQNAVTRSSNIDTSTLQSLLMGQFAIIKDASGQEWMIPSSSVRNASPDPAQLHPTGSHKTFISNNNSCTQNQSSQEQFSFIKDVYGKEWKIPSRHIRNVTTIPAQRHSTGLQKNFLSVTNNGPSVVRQSSQEPFTVIEDVNEKEWKIPSISNVRHAPSTPVQPHSTGSHKMVPSVTNTGTSTVLQSSQEPFTIFKDVNGKERRIPSNNIQNAPPIPSQRHATGPQKTFPSVPNNDTSALRQLPQEAFRIIKDVTGKEWIVPMSSVKIAPSKPAQLRSTGPQNAPPKPAQPHTTGSQNASPTPAQLHTTGSQSASSKQAQPHPTGPQNAFVSFPNNMVLPQNTPLFAMEGPNGELSVYAVPSKEKSTIPGETAPKIQNTSRQGYSLINQHPHPTPMEQNQMSLPSSSSTYGLSKRPLMSETLGTPLLKKPKLAVQSELVTIKCQQTSN